jgi:hypothetical protein
MDAKRDAECEAEISLFDDHNADIPDPILSAQITQLFRRRNQAISLIDLSMSVTAMLRSTCIRVGILGKAAVDASPRKHVVVPPFCKKPPAASRTFEGLEPNPSDGVERHPTKRCYKRWRCGFESPYGQKSE